jgi:tetratricopeptide (TPR) repeat protein
VGNVSAPGGKIAVINENYGPVTMGDSRPANRHFVDVPPQPGHPLVGRDEALAKLRARVCRIGGVAALSALNGSPGVGKTALTLALAYDEEALKHFRGGVLWAGLGRKADVSNVLNRWGTALKEDVSAGQNAVAKARLLSPALHRSVRGEPVLLVLDDAWTWKDLEPFRAISFPGCAHVVTTRDTELARRFAGEATSIGALPDSEATTFLAERCPLANELNPEGLQQLARAVGGLPLGLVLIAAALKARAGQAVWLREEIERLNEAEARLGLEDTDERPGLEGVPTTLRAIVELSIEGLTENQQEAFAALGTFAPKPADFEREAAFAVWRVGAKLGDMMLHFLTERGLLEIAGENRFALHQVLAAVAAARLDRRSSPREAHAEFYLALARGETTNWRRVERELEQIRRAWAWVSGPSGSDEQVLAYTFTLRTFFKRRGLWTDRLMWITRALSAARTLNQAEDEAALLNNMGRGYDDMGDKARALQFYEQALCIWREVMNRFGEASTLNNIACIYSDLGENARALELFEQILPIRREVGDRSGEATTLNNMGRVCHSLGKHARALSLYEKALPILRNEGDRFAEATTLNNVGGVHAALGAHSHALLLYEEALAVLSEVGDRHGEAATLDNMGRVCEILGDDARALSLYEKALPIVREIGDHQKEAVTLSNLGRVCHALGEHTSAISHLEKARDVWQKLGKPSSEVETLNHIARICERAGDRAHALQIYKEALRICRELGNHTGEATTLRNIASLPEQNEPLNEMISLPNRADVLEKTEGHSRGTPDGAAIKRVRGESRGPDAVPPRFYRGLLALSPWILVFMALVATLVWLLR